MSTPSGSNGGPVFWGAMAAGGAVTLFGTVGILTADGNGLGSFVPWFVGGALVVDLVVVPLAAGVGWAGRRLVPPAAWPVVRGGLLASAALVAFAAPLVAHLGGAPGNDSLRPRRYGSGLATALLVVWAIALGSLALQELGRRFRNRGTEPRGHGSAGTDRPDGG